MKGKKSKIAGAIWWSAFVMFAALLVFSSRQVLLYWREERANIAVNSHLEEIAVQQVKSTEQEQHESTPLTVDFEALCKENKDIIAWLYAEDTVINYPIVQSDDNDYYLRRLLDGSYNMAGTIFADYRNTADFSDWNTIVYGHNMKNGTMFSILLQYAEQEYYDAHPAMYLFTPQVTFKIEWIAGFVTESDSQVYENHLLRESRDWLVQTALEQSDFVTSKVVDSEDRLITFSTCTNDLNDERYVLIGVLTPQ